MHLSFRQIDIFRVVAQLESYTRAAEKLHLTQPAVSMQVKQLEEDTGLALFERHGKRMCLTNSGKELLHYANQVLHSYSDMLSAIEDLRDLSSGHLVISVATTATYFITKLLADFTTQHEGITLTLDVTNRQQLLLQLENFEPDLVIMGEPPKGYNLSSERLMENPLVVIASPSHPLAGQQQIKLREIVNERFAVRERGSGTRNAIERHFMSHGVQCSSTLEMRSNETIKHSAEAGLGLGIVSLHTIQLELESGRLVVLNVESFPIRRHWHIVTRKGKRLTQVARLFRDFVKREAPRTPLLNFPA